MEQRAFSQRAEQYKDMIFRIAWNYFGNPYDAEDMVQEVLLKLYLEKKPFEGEAHIRNWLIRVTLNLCRNTLRSPWRKRCIPLDEMRDEAAFERPEQEELFQTVMRMPAKDRTVLYLFYYEELSIREIAQVLRVKESTVTPRLSRARQRLRSELTEVLGNG